ncbi:NADPH:quinone reductase [Sinomicrobium oceani]|uniref:NADPH:quinone reductase n=1 Tax=Sinomicrobium oceani TaxID=1150368 RepID=A0A1K1M4C7_9FLAO|nr:NADP-dependent oxidoreductase [Sinomicrobium oceani]SFW17980.1 NADPH:quinone reductase [Sinomicrobium oceani]
MKAILLKQFGGTENLVEEEIAVPAILENEVLVKVRAFSINPVDVKTRNGEALAELLKHEDPVILGWDISGVIVDTGKNVTLFKLHDEVFGMVNFTGHGKAYAEYVAVPAAHVALKPENISHVAAAATTLAALTAWQAFTYFGKLNSGDKVLIHAAAGGVGHFAVQIARHLGAFVVGTSSGKHREFVLGLGADRHIDYRTEDFEDELRNIDFVLETIGHDTFRRSVRVLREGGTVVNLPSGLKAEDENAALRKKLNACFFMSVFSSGNDMKIIAALLERKIIRPYIYKVYSFTEVREAHLQIETGRTKGKVVVEV